MRKKFNFFITLVTLMLPLMSFGQDTLTVNNGTETNSSVPIYGLFVDNYLKCEFVIPAEDLVDMTNGSISAMTFYLSSTAYDTWGDAHFLVFLKEVETATVNDFSGTNDATVVYEGNLDGMQSEMVIDFGDISYTYTGGNLLVGVYNIVRGTYKNTSFYGVSATDASISGYSADSLDGVTGTQRNFLPKVTFTYTADSTVACQRPVGLTYDDVTANSAALSWTSVGTETEWTLEVNGTERTGITENPCVLTDLVPNTEYSIRVKAVCSEIEESTWSGPVLFNTPCEAVTTLAEDFESDIEGLPDCWTKIGDGTVAVQTSQPNSGSHSLRFSGVTGGNRVALPPVESYAGMTLSFYTKPEETANSNCGSFSVGYMTNLADTSTFQTLETYNYDDSYFDGDVYYEMNIDLSDVPANASIVFDHNADATYFYWFVDDVNVAVSPTCLRPTYITVDSITTNSATISWTDNNTTDPQSWTIELNGVDTTVTSNPFTFDNLTVATIYTVKVSSNCTDEDASDWSDEVTFSTDCEVFVVTDSISYTEGFEEESACWLIDAENSAYTWEYGTVYNYDTYADDAYIYFEGNSFTLYTAKLISPVLDITEVTNPYVSFAHVQEIWDDGQNILRVYYRADNDDDWTLLVEDTTSISDWQIDEIALPNPSATYQIAFEAESHYGQPIAVDDVNIFNYEEATPCATPTDVAVDNGVVTWTGDADNYNVVITVEGDTAINTTVNTNSYTIEGLNEGDHAIVTIQAVCAEDELSDWSEGVEFDYTGTGISSYNLEANIYPNPTTGNVIVESNAINADITVFDMFGKLMMTSKIASERTELNFSNFAHGVYTVRIANATGISTIKVVKE